MNNCENKTAENNKNTLLWLNCVCGRRKWQIVVMIVLQSLLGASSVGYAMLLRGMIDAAVEKEQNDFLIAAGVLTGLILFQLLCRACERLVEENARATFENRLKERLFSVLLNRDFASVNAVHSGEWINRLTSDTVIVADGLVGILPGAAGMMIKMISALAMLLVLEPRFGWFIVPGGIMLILVSYNARKFLKALHKRIQERDGRLRVFFQEHLGSLLVVHSFTAEKQVLGAAKERMKEHKKARMKKSWVSAVCNLGYSGIMQGVYVFGAVFCSYGIMTGTITYGTLTAILQLISQVQNPVANITGYLPKYYAMIASVERLMDAERFTKDFDGTVLNASQIGTFYDEKFQAIGLEKASFTYLLPVQEPDHGEMERDRMPVVIKDVYLEIQKGDYVAFTGHSGSGKSTILKLFLCLYPLDEGRRYLKETDGKYTDLDGTWRKLFSYVPQGNHLMNGTIREIIAFADQEKSRDEKRMRRALEIACADTFVEELSQGLDTVLGERGQGLSEGQMQRIAIARAIFADNPILILDEATSALDDETEKRLLSNLKTMTNKTVLIVTHRPAALEICNKQVMIEADDIRMVERMPYPSCKED